MDTRPLTDLRKLSQNQLNAIRKEDLIQSILSAPEPVEDASHEVMSKLSALIIEVAEIRKSLTSPDSPSISRCSVFKSRCPDNKK